MPTKMRKTFLALGKDLMEMRRERTKATQSFFVRKPKRAYKIILVSIFCFIALAAYAIAEFVKEGPPPEEKLGVKLLGGKREDAVKASKKLYLAYKAKNIEKLIKLTTHFSKSRRNDFKHLICQIKKANFSKALVLKPDKDPSLTYAYFPLHGSKNKLQLIFVKDTENNALRIKDLLLVEPE
jgi:hypothetical protein